MTNVPEMRFMRFIDAWTQRKLGEVCGNFKSGNTITADSIFDVGEYPVYGGNGLRGYTDNFTHDGDFVLIGRQGALCGNINTVSGKVYISEHAVAISENEISSIDYLEQLLSKLQLNRFSESSAQPGLSVDKLKKIDAYIPSKPEQAAIGTFFLTFDDILAATQRKVVGLKQLKAAYLQQMFPQAGEHVPRIRFEGFTGDWENKKLGEVSTVEMCRRIFKEETSSTGDVPFYKIGTFGGKPDAYISQSIFDEYKTKYSYPEIGDILISASGTIGRTVTYQGEKAYFQDSNIVWLNTNKEQLANIFLQQFYQIAKWSGIEGTTIKRLYNSNILDTNIALPAIREQTAIGNFFCNFNVQITTQSEKLEKLKQLKSAYLQKMFI